MGSPYYFAEKNESYPDNWNCLFKDKRIEDISPRRAKSEVLGALNAINPDIIISGPIAFTSGAASVYWAVRNTKKIIVFDDARYSDVPRSWWVNLIKKKVYQCVDALFCPSPDWIETYKRFGFRKEQLFYGVDVVDNEFWRRSENESGIKINSGYFLSVGRFVAKKNFILLLKAYRKFADSVQDPADLILIGQGPEEKTLKSYASDNKLMDKIHFYPFKTQDELRTFYLHASWFILPSKFGESWGLVVNEAMASGLPVLVSDQAGCGRILIKNGQNGFHFSPQDDNELANWLIRINLIPENERKKMGDKSLEIISAWDIDRFCKGLLEAINFVLDYQKKPPDLISGLFVRLWNGRYRQI